MLWQWTVGGLTRAPVGTTMYTIPIVHRLLVLNYSKAYCNVKSLVNWLKNTLKSPDFATIYQSTLCINTVVVMLTNISRTRVRMYVYVHSSGGIEDKCCFPGWIQTFDWLLLVPVKVHAEGGIHRWLAIRMTFHPYKESLSRLLNKL